MQRGGTDCLRRAFSQWYKPFTSFQENRVSTQPSAAPKRARSKDTGLIPKAPAPATTAKRTGVKAPPAPVAQATRAEPASPKHKLVRDSFTMPKHEYAVIAELKERALQFARPVKKSEILRAGIRALSKLSDRSLLSALDAVPSLKSGRPKREAPAPAGKSAPKKR
jgi:hypothetical protein